MEHTWIKLDSYESDYRNMPVTTTTIAQCQNCRCVRKIYEHSGYCDLEPCKSVLYSIGNGWIDAFLPCLDELPPDAQLRNEIKELRQSLINLEKKVYLR